MQSLLDGLMGVVASAVWIPSNGVKKSKQFALFVLELHIEDAGIQLQHGKSLLSWSPGSREGSVDGEQTIFLANPPPCDNL